MRQIIHCNHTSRWALCSECRKELVAAAAERGRNEQAAEIKRLNAVLDKCLEALTLLVKLKAHKDEFGKDESYQTIQPVAWENARAALAAIRAARDGGKAT